MQYTRLISLTPAANKPGELHRIRYCELRLARTSPNTIQDSSLNLKNLLQTDLDSIKKTHSSLSVANFLTGFVKSKVCAFIALRLATGFAKTISTPVWPPSEKISVG